ncbi:alpha/beta hydrolase [Pseudomaricurvus alkylphenolicus]|uniref:alpha/beta fold hydrolase n=1 Tax=Pseudomaricurvus alkylphenolicus TaxID=1306991 RepID=UPI001421E3DE|nr:alpha/beta hydrolase [Pseudomaricurvus alkylphenolicus]NIB42198.1 alpha/beta hydrolase [Pseudomaricurvus alkylphenolicus]
MALNDSNVHSSFSFLAKDGLRITTHRWKAKAPKAIVIIVHGAAEHARRYRRLAQTLLENGYGVFAPDLRGHGLTARDSGLGVFASANGWNLAVDDLHQLNQIVGESYPNLPIAMLGHSMGSLMTQQYMALYGDSIEAVALSGSTLVEGFDEFIPTIQAELNKEGREAPCRTMGDVLKGGFADSIENARSHHDWLSRDSHEVQAYSDDPLCGIDLSIGAWLDMLRHNRIPRAITEFEQIPKQLPVYLFAGDKDPVNGNLSALFTLIDHYAAAGIEHIAHDFYPGGRHEMLNEINRDEVTDNLLTWLHNALSPHFA